MMTIASIRCSLLVAVEGRAQCSQHLKSDGVYRAVEENEAGRISVIETRSARRIVENFENEA